MLIKKMMINSFEWVDITKDCFGFHVYLGNTYVYRLIKTFKTETAAIKYIEKMDAQ